MSAAGSLRVVMGEDAPEEQYVLRQALAGLGHSVVGIAATGQELVRLCREQLPDLVVSDVVMPGGDGLEAAAAVCAELPVPVLMVSAYQEDELLERAGACPAVMAYLAKPVRPEHLRPAIAVALRRFEHVQALQREAGDLRQALEDRKLVERAKGAVMRRLRLDEQEAFRKLKKFGSDRNLKLVEVARQVLAAEHAFRQLDEC